MFVSDSKRSPTWRLVWWIVSNWSSNLTWLWLVDYFLIFGSSSNLFKTSPVSFAIADFSRSSLTFSNLLIILTGLNKQRIRFLAMIFVLLIQDRFSWLSTVHMLLISHPEQLHTLPLPLTNSLSPHLTHPWQGQKRWNRNKSFSPILVWLVFCFLFG